MRRADEVSPEKLRGGFYTPAPLVMFTLERLREARGASLTGATVLEPSAGDGAFVRALAAAADAPRRLIAVEREPSEAAKLPFAAAAAPAEVHNESFFAWAARAPAPVDAVVGNPPFVRYQFVPAEDRAQADALLHAQGRAVGGVANLWVPFVLVALHQLRPGGAFALVLPAELLSTASTGPSARRPERPVRGPAPRSFPPRLVPQGAARGGGAQRALGRGGGGPRPGGPQRRLGPRGAAALR
jgi:adenine-specific DNA-methyltransferase